MRIILENDIIYQTENQYNQATNFLRFQTR